MWNYSKTPARGVREMELYVDDGLVYRGTLKQSPRMEDLPSDVPPRGQAPRDYSLLDGLDDDDPYCWGHAREPNLSQTVLFTNDERILERERGRVPLAELVRRSYMPAQTHAHGDAHIHIHTSIHWSIHVPVHFMLTPAYFTPSPSAQDIEFIDGGLLRVEESLPLSASSRPKTASARARD